jgi:hypothetical protein
MSDCQYNNCYHENNKINYRSKSMCDLCYQRNRRKYRYCKCRKCKSDYKYEQTECNRKTDSNDCEKVKGETIIIIITSSF